MDETLQVFSCRCCIGGGGPAERNLWSAPPNGSAATRAVHRAIQLDVLKELIEPPPLAGKTRLAIAGDVIHSIGEPSFEKFKDNLDKKFEGNGMIHTMMSIYGIGHNQWRSEKSSVSGDYKEWPRFCDGLE
ncbi:MAG: hypothetical protein M3Z96_13660 [Pseudomonadota bacterium]|nr:hypothetical protein [Pseudomonadota bacterium]